MIDFISCETFLTDKQANNLLKKPSLQWKTTIDKETGEIERYSCEHKFMRFSIEYQKTFFAANGQKFKIRRETPVLRIRNSIHRFWHGGNNTDFMRRDLLEAFEYMKTKLGIDPSVLRRKSFEFGVNIETIEPPPSIFGTYLDYREKPFLPMKKRSGIEKLSGATGVECEASQFRIKAYDKGKQYGLDSNLYRFEVAVKKVQFIEKQGIKIEFLSDLAKLETLESLGNLLLKIHDNIRKKTPYNEEKVKELTAADRELLRVGDAPQYWEHLRIEKSRTKVWNTKKKYKELLNVTALKDIHGEMRESISRKWEQLLTGKMNKVTTFEKLSHNCKTEQNHPSKVSQKRDSFESKMNKVTTRFKGNIVHIETVSFENRVCVICGNDLMNRRPNVVTCSKTCRNKKFRAVPSVKQ